MRCDRSTTTHGDIARGVVTISVGIAPLKSAEFVILRLSGTAGQS